MDIKDWIPVFSEAVWPSFILLFSLFFRKRISQILKSINEKISSGSSVEIGNWLKIDALSNEDKAIKKELDTIRNEISDEIQKEKPDSEILSRLHILQQTIETQKEELEAEVQKLTLSPLSMKTESIATDVGIIIGHKKSSPGIVNNNYSITEFEYNEELSILIEKKLKELDISSERIYRRTFKDLPDDINKLNPSIAFSLHANGFNGMMSGSEVLYRSGSENGRKIAGIILENIVNILNLPNRGIKATTSHDRGGYLLEYTKPTTIIIEPFFMDNNSDISIAIDKKDELAHSIAMGVKKYLTS